MVASGSTHACVDQTLPGFTICVPPGWVLKKGVGDSASGRFTADDLMVKYDFGLYSDPLKLPGNPSASERDVQVDGRLARQVAYAGQATGKTMHFVGIHVPRIVAGTTTPLKLTILAESADATRLGEATAAFATIRFTAPVTR